MITFILIVATLYFGCGAFAIGKLGVTFDQLKNRWFLHWWVWPLYGLFRMGYDAFLAQKPENIIANNSLFL